MNSLPCTQIVVISTNEANDIRVYTPLNTIEETYDITPPRIYHAE